jgi:hypothetical protein
MLPVERKIKWATNFFIWSAVVFIVFRVFEDYDVWARYHSIHPEWTSVETVGAFLRWMAGGDAVFIFVLVNGLLLRRYKSRIAAGLFVALGLFVVGSELLWWPLHGFTLRAVLMDVLYGAYFLIACWLMVALKTQHAWTPSDSDLDNVFR